MRKILHSLPLLPLIMMSIFLGLAPFTPEPHLFEKIRMLMAGTLSNATDIFDLLMHSTPVLLLSLKLLFAKDDAAS